MSNKVHIELTSEKTSIKAVEPLLADFKQLASIDDEKYYNILIAVTEAVNNAIYHGNDCDVNKKVSIYAEYKSDELIISVTDQGGGFDPQDVADPRDPENLLKDSGRGVFLIKELSSDYRFIPIPGGMMVTMKFKI